MTFGDKLAKLRKQKNLTQEQLADMLNVSRQSVSKWESDISYPETEKLISLAKLFDCSTDYLLINEHSEFINKYQDNKPKSASTHQKTIGYIFLAISLTAGILTMLLAKNEETLLLALIVTATLLVISAICLAVKQNAGYWCAWAGFAPFVLLSPQIVSMRFLTGIDISVICFYVIMFFVAKKIFNTNVTTNSKKSTLIIIGWVLWAVAKLSIYIIPFIIAKNAPIIFAEDTLSLFINPLFYIQTDFIFYVIMAFLLTYTVCYQKSLKSTKP